MIKKAIIILAAVFLTACTQERIIYRDIPREPITCINRIKTPLDMAKCLAEYSAKY